MGTVKKTCSQVGVLWSTGWGLTIDGQTGFRLARAVNLFLLVGRVSLESVDEQVRVKTSSIMDLIPIIQG